MNAVAEKPTVRPADTQSQPAEPVRVPAPPRRLPVKPLIAAVVLIGGGVTANWWFTEGAYLQSTDNAYVQGDIAVLGPRIEGDVVAINAANNTVVHAGDRLITLDPTDRQAMLDQARAAEGEAQAAIAVAARQVQQQRTAIAQTEAAIASAEAELTRASSSAQRSGALAGAGWTSRADNETAVADRLKAQAALASARAQADTARQTLAVAEAQLVQANARLATAQTQVRIAATNLTYTVLVAPFDGIVGNRAVQLGQHVMPGQQMLAVTPVARQLYVVANFKETQLARMKPGQKVVLTADINTAEPITGHVDSLAPATGALFSLLPPENATGNFTKVVQRVPVRIAIDKASAEHATWLRAGLSVTAEVDTRDGDPTRLGLLGAALHLIGLR